MTLVAEQKQGTGRPHCVERGDGRRPAVTCELTTVDEDEPWDWYLAMVPCGHARGFDLFKGLRYVLPQSGESVRRVWRIGTDLVRVCREGGLATSVSSS